MGHLANLLTYLKRILIFIFFSTWAPTLGFFTFVIFLRFPSFQNFYIYILTVLNIFIISNLIHLNGWKKEIRQLKEYLIESVNSYGFGFQKISIQNLLDPYLNPNDKNFLVFEDIRIEFSKTDVLEKIEELYRKNVTIIRFDGPTAFASYISVSDGYILVGNQDWQQPEKVPPIMKFALFHEISHGFEISAKYKLQNYLYVPFTFFLSIFFIEYTYISIGIYLGLSFLILSGFDSRTSIFKKHLMMAEFEADKIAVSLLTILERRKMLELLARQQTLGNPLMDSNFDIEDNFIRTGRLMYALKGGILKKPKEIYKEFYSFNEISRMLQIGLLATFGVNLFATYGNILIIILVVIFFIIGILALSQAMKISNIKNVIKSLINN